MATYSKLATSIRSGIRAMVRKRYPGVKLEIRITDYPGCGENIDLWVKDAPFDLEREGVHGHPGEYFDLMSEQTKTMVKAMLAYVKRRAGNADISASWYVGWARLW